uniref:Craniofacial development protein 2 n=2 Tax=Cacopsylla melanoneura TaxID=428564 RepID=A0A8D8PW97_9HEMI
MSPRLIWFYGALVNYQPLSTNLVNEMENGRASDVTLPRDLTGPQRMTVATRMAGCVKYANANKSSTKQKDKMKIGTWNVQGLNKAGKLDNLLNEMKNMSIDICGISETFWDDCSDFYSSLPCGANYRIINSGGNKKRKGVAIITSQNVSKLITSVYMISERIIAIKIDTKPINSFVIQCYAPNLDSEQNVKDQFYDDLRQTINHKLFQEVVILLGDFNAKVGDKRMESIVGPHGLGDMNPSGEDLINFCSENNLFITNTWFQQKKSARHTWTSPDGHTKNQIDFICVSNRFRNAVTNAKTRPGADIETDHNLVLMNMKIKLKKPIKKNTNAKKWAINNNPDTKRHFTERITQKLQNLYDENYCPTNMETNWNNLKDSLTSTAQEVLGTVKPLIKQKWMTEDILKEMEERKKYKNSKKPEDIQKYKELKSKIQKMCRQKKDEYINTQCEEAEKLEAIDSRKFHQKIKEMTTTTRKLSYCLEDAHGNEIYDSSQMLARWKEYCEGLYKDQRPSETPNFVINENEIPEFSINDISKAIKKLSNNKAYGPDNIPAELVKLLDTDGLVLITDIVNTIYKTGEIPSDFLTSIFITLPKVNKAKKCTDFRTISLISHTSKILLQIIKERIKDKIESNLSETQMGFRSGKGCRDALTVMRILLEKNIDKNNDIFMAFIDYEKAFDKVNHEKLIEILEKVQIPKVDIRLIATLYWGQKGRVKTPAGLSEEFNIEKGVRQGCIISPLLFNIYAEQIIKEALENRPQGIILKDRLINNLRYADDLVLFTSSRNSLILLLENLFESSSQYNMKVNIKKSKIMRISKSENSRIARINIDGQSMEEVNKYKYLGAVITKNAKCEEEIKIRIGIAKSAFWKHREMMQRNISRKTKLRLLQTYIFSILTYGCESWTFKNDISKKITAFENWCYRRILKIKWQDKITNSEVLRRIGKTQFEWLNVIRERKIKFAGHVLRGSSGQLMLDVLEGDCERPRQRGRPRRMWFDDVKEWMDIPTLAACKTLANDRELFRSAANAALSRLATIVSDDATQ